LSMNILNNSFISKNSKISNEPSFSLDMSKILNKHEFNIKMSKGCIMLINKSF
jgi:hypothetical protein